MRRNFKYAWLYRSAHAHSCTHTPWQQLPGGSRFVLFMAQVNRLLPLSKEKQLKCFTDSPPLCLSPIYRHLLLTCSPPQYGHIIRNHQKVIIQRQNLQTHRKNDNLLWAVADSPSADPPPTAHATKSQVQSQHCWAGRLKITRVFRSVKAVEQTRRPSS